MHNQAVYGDRMLKCSTWTPPMSSTLWESSGYLRGAGVIVAEKQPPMAARGLPWVASGGNEAPVVGYGAAV